MHTGFLGESQNERYHYENLDLDGRILKYILDKYDATVWIHPDKDRNQRRDLVRMVTNFRIPLKKLGNSRVAERQLAPQE
jgi:hypothetical protein